MADLHFYPFFERLPALGSDVLPANKFPLLTAWMSAMQHLECVRKYWISPKQHSRYLAGYLAGKPDYDMELDEETIVMQRSVG